MLVQLRHQIPSSTQFSGQVLGCLNCAHRGSTFLACGLCEHRDHPGNLAPSPSLTRKRSGDYSQNWIEIATFMRI